MESIAHLLSGLPDDYESDCFATGAIKRKRGVGSAADLMLLALFHLHNGCTLLETSEVARMTNLGEMSDVAFMNRFEKCRGWFETINAKLMAESLVNYRKPAFLEGRQFIAADASDVVEKGRSGRTYRLHYALDVFTMTSSSHKITTNEVGESLCNFAIPPGSVVVGDRAYSTIRGIEHCLESGAQYILRLRKNSFTLRDEFGAKIELLSILEKLGDGECADFTAFATNEKKETLPVRVCARRKTPDSIEKTKKRLARIESRKQCSINPETKAFNEFVIVVTSLGCDVSAADILDAYRLRWQVEIYFKRLKSIMDFGELPKRRNDSVLAWLNGKLMVALLIESWIAKIAFSP